MKTLSYILTFGVPLLLIVGMAELAMSVELLPVRTPRKAVVLGAKTLTRPSAAEVEAASFCRQVGHGCQVWQ